eukprot:COSAG04_NODE_31412_length_257_cov_0.626582_1_plen_33_part_01
MRPLVPGCTQLPPTLAEQLVRLSGIIQKLGKTP